MATQHHALGPMLDLEGGTAYVPALVANCTIDVIEYVPARRCSSGKLMLPPDALGKDAS